MGIDTPKSASELVITAPEEYANALAIRSRARLTLGVLTQIVAGSSHFVLLAAPFIQQENSLVSGPLYEALRSAIKRGVNITIVSTGAGLEALNCVDLVKGAKGQLRLFQPRANFDDPRQLGSHAKLCIADGSHAYVGSANLTLPGLTENLEMGLLVHGDLAKQITEFWQFLLQTNFFVEAGLPK